MLGSTNKGITSRDREVIIPLCSALVRTPGILGGIWDYAIQNIMWTGRREKSTKMTKRLGGLCEEMAQKTRFAEPWGKRAEGTLYYHVPVFEGAHRDDGDSVFTRSHMEKTRDSGYKLLLGRFRLDARGKFFTEQALIGLISPGKCWIPQHWHWYDLTRQDAVPSCLDHAFSKKYWTRWSLRSLPTFIFLS